MGIETASEKFRKSSLNRYPSQEKIKRAFKIWKEAGIKRTAYNIIGLPNENESMILDTIKFNQELDPDNLTVAFYSPFLGTIEQLKSKEIKDFDSYEYLLIGDSFTNGACVQPTNNIAGIFNKEKNILGMMPHPERAIDKLTGNISGLDLFSSLIG